MASSVNLIFFVCFLFFFSIQSQARMPQSFNKASAATGESTTAVEPSFVPANENQYGLYNSESFAGEKISGAGVVTGEAPRDFGFDGRLPEKYGPGNFEEIKDSTLSGKGPAAEAKDFSGKENFEEAKDSTLSAKDFFAVDEKDELDEVFPEAKSNGGASFNARGNYFPSGGESRPQGMSDTRSFDNGKYFYDVNEERFSSSHPYEALKAAEEDPAVYRPNFNYRHNYADEFSRAGEGYQYGRRNRGTYGNWP